MMQYEQKYSIKFRVTEEEAAEIRRKANATGMNLSKFLRTADVNIQVVLYNTADVYEFRSEINKIGNYIYNAVVKAQLKIWNKDSGCLYWSYKLLTDTVNTQDWLDRDS